VDDIILHGPGGPMITTVKHTLKSEFEGIDLEDHHWLLVIHIKFGPKGIELSQSTYTDSILSGYWFARL
jgi:hypothetical protein